MRAVARSTTAVTAAHIHVVVFIAFPETKKNDICNAENLGRDD